MMSAQRGVSKKSPNLQKNSVYFDFEGNEVGRGEPKLCGRHIWKPPSSPSAIPYLLPGPKARSEDCCNTEAEKNIMAQQYWPTYWAKAHRDGPFK